MQPDQVLFTAGSVADGYREYLEPVIFRPWADRLVDFAGLEPGQRVLDVASGTGVVARAAGARVGAGGHIVASDISAGMLAHVADGFPGDGATVETLESSATDLKVDDGSFDAVLCQQGLPFIPDREAAAREMLRVLRPGGTAAVAVWLAGARLDPFATYAEVLVEHEVREPYPGAFDTATYCMSLDDVEAALTKAGFADVVVETQQLELAWPSPQTVARAVCGTPFWPAVAGLEEPRRAAVLARLEERTTGAGGAPVRHVMTAVFGRGRR